MKPTITHPARSRFFDELFSLQGKVAVVTGAGSGIGRGIAKYLSVAGAAVVVADMNEAHGERVAQELRALGARSLAVRTDVSDERSVDGMVQKTLESFDRIDIIVNDAGIFPFASIAAMSLADWEHVQDVNLRGTFLCLQKSALQMRKQRSGGRIINISSIDSLHPSTVGLAHYDASKGGVNMLTRSAALEFGPDRITINAILPGSIATEGAAAAMASSPELQAPSTMNDRIVLGRTGTPEDIAGAALFLASNAASYITGQTLVVDGGYLIG